MATSPTSPAPSPADALRATIEAAGGAIPFDRFMDLALYGAGGFYTSGGQAGRRGDFITSPEVGPLFGAVLARAIEGWWRELGEPEDFTVVEAGAGPGTLARSIRSVDARWRYVAVEIAAQQRAQHPADVVSSDAFPEGRFTGVIIANELLDNLPFRLAVFDGGWREALVTTQRDGTFAEELGPLLEPVPAFLPARAAHGSRAPLQDRAAAWVAMARRQLVRGRVVCIDYCTPRTAALAMQPWRDWLRTYRDHERGGHYLAAAGEQDITAQLAVDQLPEPDAVRTQAQFLQRWAIDELVEEGRRGWEAAAAAPTLAALRLRSRIREAEALLDPAGLGSFHVLEWAAES